MTKTDKDLVYEVIKLSQFDANSSIFWRWNNDRTEIDVYADCSDVFAWGCSDGEQITWENLDVLRQSIADVESITENPYSNKDDGFLLFCARVRGMRPQGAMYKYLEVLHKDEEIAAERTAKLRELFNAAGPEREAGFGNPIKHTNTEWEYQKLGEGISGVKTDE